MPCQDTGQGTVTLFASLLGAEKFPLGHIQLLEMTLGLVERPWYSDIC